MSNPPKSRALWIFGVIGMFLTSLASGHRAAAADPDTGSAKLNASIVAEGLRGSMGARLDQRLRSNSNR